MGHKILLAAVSITVQKVIELTVSDENFELHTVGNGQRAIDEIRSVRPDIVLCDIIMPEKNGYEVCEFIKSNDNLKQIPVLLLTGAFEPFDQERAKAAGCEGFLAKPFEPQTLVSKVKELLAGAAGGVARAAPAPVQPPAPVPPPAAPPPAPEPDFAGIPIEDETVLVQPPSLEAPPPVAGPQVPVAPVPPPIEPAPIEGLDEAFAVEAGERELTMDPGDHTMLLAAPDVPAAPAPPTSGDDIWSQMPEAPAAPAPEAPASTVPEPPTIAIPMEAPLAVADAFVVPTGDDVAEPIPSIDAPATIEPAAADVFEEMAPPSAPEPDGSDDDLVERIAQRVVDKLSAKVIQEIAWEVVPDLAEGLIQKEIDTLKSKIPKSG